jgi:hypothetical protein
MQSISGRLGGAIAGLVFVIGLVVLVFIAPAPPAIDDSSGEFLDYLSDKRTHLMVQSSLMMLLWIPLALFAPWLWRYVDEREAPDSYIGLIAATSLVAGWALFTVVQMSFGGLAYVADQTLAADEARNLTVIFSVLWKAVIAALAITAVASGIVFVAQRSGLRWVGWFGIAVAVVIAAAQFTWSKEEGILAPDAGGFLPFLLVMVYLLVVAIAMTRAARRPAA